MKQKFAARSLNVAATLAALALPGCGSSTPLSEATGPSAPKAPAPLIQDEAPKIAPNVQLRGALVFVGRTSEGLDRYSLSTGAKIIPVFMSAGREGAAPGSSWENTLVAGKLFQGLSDDGRKLPETAQRFKDYVMADSIQR